MKVFVATVTVGIVAMGGALWSTRYEVLKRPWHHYYPCNMMVIDYQNGDVYIVNTAHIQKYGDVYGSSHLFHHREDAERVAERLMRTSTCTYE